MEKKSYTVAIDLGSSQVVVAVGAKSADGPMQIVALAGSPVEGVSAGQIENIEQVGNAISNVIAKVEQQLGFRISEAYAGISGDFVRCARHTDHVFATDPQNGINRRDVDALFDRMRNVQAPDPDEEKILERVPQNYKINDQNEVKNPVGSFGYKLSSTFNFILCQQTPLQRLDMALRRVNIKRSGVFANSMATPEAVLSPGEKEEGVAVVDIGAGVTDVTVYYGNVVRYVAAIPMGASAFNRDIRSQGIPAKRVEELKLAYGSAVPDLAENKGIKVPGSTGRDSKVILLHNLATIIEARACDLIDFVKQELKDSGFEKQLAYGLVLTGGSAKLKNLDELFRRQTGMEVRVGRAEFGIDEESAEKYGDPAYATAIGLLLRGAQLGACAVSPVTPRSQPQPQPQPRIPSQHAPGSGAFVPPVRPAAPGPAPRPQAQMPLRPSQAEVPEPEREPEPDSDPDYEVKEERKPHKRGINIGKIISTIGRKINAKFDVIEDNDDDVVL